MGDILERSGAPLSVITTKPSVAAYRHLILRRT